MFPTFLLALVRYALLPDLQAVDDVHGCAGLRLTEAPYWKTARAAVWQLGAAGTGHYWSLQCRNSHRISSCPGRLIPTTGRVGPGELRGSRAAVLWGEMESGAVDAEQTAKLQVLILLPLHAVYDVF